MKISARISEPTLDIKRFTRDGQRAIREVFYKSVEAFLVAASQRVPVETGMARGSFLNVLQYLRGKGISPTLIANIYDTPQKLDKKGKPLRYHHVDGRNLTKTPRTAKGLSTKPAKIGSVRNVYDMVFEFETSVVHFNYNEFLRGWGAFEAGREAFMATAASRKFTIPNVINYMTVSVLTYGADFPKEFARANGPFRVRRQRKVK